MAIISELEAPDGDMDATVSRPKIGSVRVLDTRAFRPYRPRGYYDAEGGPKSSAHAGVKTLAKAFSGKKAHAAVKSKTVVIPGLWTLEVAKQKLVDDDLNLSLVNLQVKLPTTIELSLNQTWYLLSGKFNLKDLADRVRYKVNLEVDCPMKFAAECVELSEETKMSAIAKNHEGPDGFVHLFCDIAQDPLRNGWIVVERKKKKIPKNACAHTRQQTPQKLIMKTELSAMIELVTESVEYSKFPSCKSKGNRKMSQFAKKRHMQLAMDQKSPFVQTKEGPAVRSFGTQ